MAPSPVFIVGYGTPLRGDDGVGQEVVEVLWARRERDPLLAAATIVQSHQLAPEMAIDISASSLAVFVDAGCDGRPGSVVLKWLRAPGEPQRSGPPFAAGCWVDVTPERLLALALELYGTAPAAAMVTVGVASLELGIGLSPVVRAAVPRAVAAAQLAITSSGPRSESSVGQRSLTAPRWRAHA